MSRLKIGDKVYYERSRRMSCGEIDRKNISGTLIGLPSSDAIKGGNSDVAYLEVLTRPDEHGCVDVKVQVVNIHDLKKSK